MRKSAVVVMGVVLVTVAGMALAEEATEGKKREHKVALKDMSVTGVLSKVESKDKEGNLRVSYVVTDDAGEKTRVPAPRAKAGAEVAVADALNLDDFVDQKVTITGKGAERKGKNGEMHLSLMKVDSIVPAAGEDMDMGE